jgi:head-tail adaptor
LTTIRDCNRQITVYQKLATRDPDYNTEVVSWVPLVPEDPPGCPLVGQRFWAEVQDTLPSRNEALIRQEIVVARSTKRIRLRYRTDIDSEMKVVVHGDSDETYGIIGGPSMVGRKEWIELFCERVANISTEITP